MHEALLTLGFGLVTAAILSLSALAFTLEYSVTNVANLIKYGSDANGNPYTSTQANPVYAPLNPGLKVHIEYGNELWNSFNAATASANITQRADGEPCGRPVPRVESMRASDSASAVRRSSKPLMRAAVAAAASGAAKQLGQTPR